MSIIVVAGALANRPGNGGGAAVRMDWVHGLGRLGFEVWFVEQLARRPTPPPALGVGKQSHDPLDFFAVTCRRAGLGGRCALLDGGGHRLLGAEAAELEKVASAAVLLINLGGHLRLPGLLQRFRRRAYVDLDPGYTQYWHAQGHDLGLRAHHEHLTVGLNVGRRGCAIPTGGFSWRPLPPPVVLEHWPVCAGTLGSFTTVASWRGSFGRLEHGGRSFGLKAHELRKLVDLPRRLPAPLEIALSIHPADGRDLAVLRRNGWRVVDPLAVAADPVAYRRYIQSSGAELSAAQGVYVETGSGWISDRTARYLASGKPALVQETGLAPSLPVGEGLVTFRSPDEAVVAARRIARDYATHCARAREIAERHFDSDRVLSGLLDTLEIAA